MQAPPGTARGPKRADETTYRAHLSRRHKPSKRATAATGTSLTLDNLAGLLVDDVPGLHLVDGLLTEARWPRRAGL